jgi:hypothetical protein
MLKSLHENRFTNLKTKIIIYKSLLKSIWTYGLQLCGATRKSNTNKIQTIQNILFRKITNASLFVSNHNSNHTLHNDLHIKRLMKKLKLSKIDFTSNFRITTIHSSKIFPFQPFLEIFNVGWKEHDAVTFYLI